MATIKIVPISTKTIGKFDAEITGIDPTDHDCLKGTIDTPGAAIVSAEWNLDGTCRDSIPQCNLDLSQNEVVDAINCARKLGVQN